MGSVWKRIPENLSADEFMLAFAQQFNQWASDKDRFESSITTPTSKRSSGSSIALTREPTVDITRVGQFAGVTGSVADIPFITVNNVSSLNAERALAVADPLNKDDNGANSTIVLGVSYTTPSLTLGTANAEGSNARPIRSDATLLVFDTTAPQGVSTSAAVGSASTAARRDHVHNIPGTDVAVVSKLTGVSSSSTFTLTDADATNQTLTGNLGNLIIRPTSGLIYTSSITPAVQTSAHHFYDENGARASGFLFAVERVAVGTAWDATRGAMRLTAGATPQFYLTRNLGNACSWIDAVSLNVFDTLTADGIPNNTALLKIDTSGTTVRFTASTTATAIQFTNQAAGGTPQIQFQLNPTAGLANPQIAFTSTGAESAASTAASFLFSKGSAFAGTQKFLECQLASLPRFALNQLLQPQILDTSANFFVTLVPTSSSALTADRTLTLDLVNANRTLKIQGNPTLDDWFDQPVKTTSDVTFDDVTGSTITSTAGKLRLKENLSAQFAIIGVSSSTTQTADRTIFVDMEDADKYAVTVRTSLASQFVGTDVVPRFVSAAGPSIEGSAVILNNTGTTDRLDLDNCTTSGASMRIASGTAPTSPAEGDYWHDSTRQCEVARYGANRHHHGGLFVATASATADATSQETLIGSGVGSLTLPANFFVAGRTIMIRAGGNVATSGSTASLITRLKFGSTTLHSATAGGGGVEVAGGWLYQAMATCRTTGATGTMFTQGGLHYTSSYSLDVANLTTDRSYDADATSVAELADIIGTLATVDMASSEEFSSSGNTTTATIDTTASITVDFTGQWDDISAGESALGSNFYMETAF